MKPRERKPQKQSSRLYLRRKDHRDCIMNDTYHNAIWLKKTKDDGTVQDELVWCKYPQNALMNIGSNSLGWIDTDRQFSFAIQQSGDFRRILRLKDIAVFITGRTPQAYYTEDGIVWKKTKTNPTLSMYYTDFWNFGENGICTYGMNISEFVKDEETDEWDVVNYTVNAPGSWWYCCRTKNGCIVRTQDYVRATDRYNIYFYEVTVDGVEKKGEILSSPWEISSTNRTTRDCSRDDYCGFALAVTYNLNTSSSIYYSTYTNRILALTSMDDGQTWEVQELYAETVSYYQSWWYDFGLARMDAFVRDGYMYVIYSDLAGNGHLWRTLTQQWNEVALPSWVDLPLLQSGGKCVGTTTKESVRLAIRPSETENADVTIANAIGRVSNEFTKLNGATYNIKFKDGKVQSWNDEDEFLAMKGLGNYVFVFDNLRFISSSKSFAFIPSAYSDSVDGRDTVQPNDYVIRP